ncbi:MAG: hypothetical protein J6A01_01880, partial [Proteobacteria bacterium]|nr:hypothetical protein [Pseudomonadota bacterium]
PTQTAADVSVPDHAGEISDIPKHVLVTGTVLPMYSYTDFDFIMKDDDVSEINGMSASYAAGELVKLIKEKEHIDGRGIVMLLNGNVSVDNSSAFEFDATVGDKRSTYYVTSWAKVFDENENYIGRIVKGGKEPGEVPAQMKQSTDEYVDFAFIFPEQSEEIEGLTREEAATYVAHQAIPELSEQSGCEPWSIVLDGTAQIEGQKAYDFSVFHQWLPKSDDQFSFMNDTKTPVSFRMAITANRKAYLYELIPDQIGTLKQMELPEPLPPDPKIAKALQKYKKKSPDGFLGTIALHALEEMIKYTGYPEYRLKIKDKADDIALDWIRNAAENLNQWIKNYKGESLTVIQTITARNTQLKLAVANSPATVSKSFERLILYRGKIEENGKTRHRFAIGQVNLETLNEKISYEIEVDEDGTFYLLKPSVSFFAMVPQDIKKAAKHGLDDDLIYDYASAQSENGSSRFCKDNYVGMNFKKKLGKDAPSSAKSANFIMDHLYRFYHGERNINPWYVTEMDHGEIKGAQTHEFTVGQGTSGDYPIYFRAAVDENGKVYRYDGDAPVYVDTLPTAKSSDSAKEDDNLKALQNRLEDMFAGVPVDDSKHEADKENHVEENTTPVYPAPKQDVDELKTIYPATYFEIPKLDSSQNQTNEDADSERNGDKLETTEYTDFDFVRSRQNPPKFKNLSGQDAAIYINSEIIPSLKMYPNNYWVMRLLGKGTAKDIHNEAMFFNIGYIDTWHKFQNKVTLAVSKDRKVYRPQMVYKYIKDMAVQTAPEVGPTEFSGFSVGRVTTVSFNYPLFTLIEPSSMPECDGYTLPQAAAEVEAAYLHDHNDGNWTIEYRGITEIEGAKAWKLRISYGNDKYSFNVAASTAHKLYHAAEELQQVGTVPAKVTAPPLDNTPDSIRERTHWDENECGIGTLNTKKNNIPEGDYVSLRLAAHWIFETMAKTYTGKQDNNPWRAVPTGTTQIEGVDAYEFDIGQGKYHLAQTYFKAAVTQDRKIYRVTDGKLELVGTIPEDAPEPRY